VRSPNDSDSLGRHDWYSAEYVDDWIRADEQRERNLDVLVERLDLTGDEPVVLDVGGGYGRLTRTVLERFPSARVVMHDFSPPMLARASAYLAPFSGRYTAVRADLRDPEWTAALGGPFDAVMSAIAIHNVREPKSIARVYQEVCGLLRPGGQFLNLDRLEGSTVADHVGWLLQAGFDPTTVAGDRVGDPLVLAAGRRPDDQGPTH
jgi:ubiquinone/menaquinone biosynthesis C-methylase UbiE